MYVQVDGSGLQVLLREVFRVTSCSLDTTQERRGVEDHFSFGG